MRIVKNISVQDIEKIIGVFGDDSVADVIDGVLIDNMVICCGDYYIMAIETPRTSWTSDYTVAISENGVDPEFWNLWDEFQKTAAREEEETA